MRRRGLGEHRPGRAEAGGGLQGSGGQAGGGRQAAGQGWGHCGGSPGPRRGGADAERAKQVGRGRWPLAQALWVPWQPPGLWSQRPQNSSGPESRSPVSGLEGDRSRTRLRENVSVSARLDPGPSWVLPASGAHPDPWQPTKKK